MNTDLSLDAASPPVPQEHGDLKGGTKGPVVHKRPGPVQCHVGQEGPPEPIWRRCHSRG